MSVSAVPSPPRLARRLLRSNLLEALAYPHGVDRYVELVRPLLLKRDVRAEIVAVAHQTPRSVTLTLRPNDNWRGLQAGQHVGLSVDVDGVRETRVYSPAGSQHARDGTLELTVSTHPQGKVSRHLREHARAGTIVGLSDPGGEFVLPDPRPERIVLISGGSGITPVMAMLRTLCDERYDGEVAFVNYARSPQLALYRSELAQLQAANPNVRVARSFTRGRGGKLTGRFCAEHLRAVGVGPADATGATRSADLADTTDAAATGVATFVCGPPALIDAVRALRRDEGSPEPAVESFTAPVFAPAFTLDPATASGEVSFLASGAHAANSGLPLLEQAEDAGLAPEHGCRMGICNTCSCTKTAGTVRNLITGELSSAGEEKIRVCVSVPVGDVAVNL